MNMDCKEQIDLLKDHLSESLDGYELVLFDKMIEHHRLYKKIDMKLIQSELKWSDFFFKSIKSFLRKALSKEYQKIGLDYSYEYANMWGKVL